MSDAGGVETYTYAADGLRRKKEAGATTTLFLWDGQNLLQETDVSLVVQAHYSTHLDTFGPVFSQRRSGTTSYYNYDVMNSIVSLWDWNHTKTDAYVLGAFGNELQVTGSTVNPMRYDGMWGYYRDTASRLYVRARHLDTVRGRWISRDPIAEDANLYRYVRNIPTWMIDPSGLRIDCDIFLGGCLLLSNTSFIICAKNLRLPPGLLPKILKAVAAGAFVGCVGLVLVRPIPDEGLLVQCLAGALAGATGVYIGTILSLFRPCLIPYAKATIACTALYFKCECDGPLELNL